MLAPVRAPLRAGAKTIGNVVLSIQDDFGYLLLAQRLAGLKVVMYSRSGPPQVVMRSFQVALDAHACSKARSVIRATTTACSRYTPKRSVGPLRISRADPSWPVTRKRGRSLA